MSEIALNLDPALFGSPTCPEILFEPFGNIGKVLWINRQALDHGHAFSLASFPVEEYFRHTKIFDFIRFLLGLVVCFNGRIR